MNARPRRFPIYAVMLYVGLIVALVTGDRLARASGLDPLHLVAVLSVSIPVCLAGARGLSVLLNWRHFREHPREILRLGRGGAAMYGALPPAFLITIPLTSWFGLPLGAFWDIAAIAILAGMIPARFGCLGNGCCAGRPTRSSFGLLLRNAQGVCERRIPSPLLEAGLGAILLAIAASAWGRLPFGGAVALLVIACYGLGRALLEGLREERFARSAGLCAFQWMSLSLCAVGTVGLAIGWVVAAGAQPLEAFVDASESGSSHLIASGLLLVPVMLLFRFLGCSLLFNQVETPGVSHELRMIAVFPDIGTGDASVRVQFLGEPAMTEIDGSPFELEAAGAQPDGRLQFELTTAVAEGSYSVVCTISRDGALDRVSSDCSGELNGPGLALAFDAPSGSAPTFLNDRICFTPLP